MEIENEANFRRAIETGLNLFLGAGFSVLAKNKLSQDLPIGNSLKDDICKEFSLESLITLDLPKIYAIADSQRRNDLRKFLVEKFTVREFDERYFNLDNIHIKSIFTTNIDN